MGMVGPLVVVVVVVVDVVVPGAVQLVRRTQTRERVRQEDRERMVNLVGTRRAGPVRLRFL